MMSGAGDENGNMKLSAESDKVRAINWRGWLNMCGWRGGVTSWKKVKMLKITSPLTGSPVSLALDLEFW